MFSVVIPLYNKAQSITATLNSVLAQNFEDFEIVLVNDGSTDGSLEVAKKIKDPRIRIITKENGGVSSARNRGIREAKYDWIAFLDGDDLWTENHLSSVIDAMNKFPDHSVFCTGFSVLNSKEEKVKDVVFEKTTILENYFETVNKLKKYIIHTSAIIALKQRLIEVGLFNEKLTHGEDLDLWERSSRTENLVMVDSISTIYRLGAENRSNVKLPLLEKTRIYNTDTSKMINPAEISYYKNGILGLLFATLLYKDFKNFMKLKRKHKSILSNQEIAGYVFKKFKEKIS